MRRTFNQIWRVQNATRMNLILYGLRSLPLINRLLPASLFANVGLKRFAFIVTVLSRIFGVFLAKIPYILVVVVLPIQFLKLDPAVGTHILFCLAIAGAILNADFFEMSKTSYYSLVLLRMNPKEYALSGASYEIVRMFVGFIVAGIVLFPPNAILLWVAVALPIFSISLKTIVVALNIHCFSQGNRSPLRYLFDALHRSVPLFIGVILACIALAYLLPWAIGFAFPPIVLGVAAVLLLVPAFFSLRSILRFNSYRAAYHRLFTSDGFRAISESNVAALSTDAMQKRIVYDASQTSQKRGYAYFNDLFVMRHRKMMTQSARTISFLSLLVVAGFVLLATFMPETRSNLRNGVLHSLPLMLFAMYFLNRGRSVAQAMFMNCDHAMLTYRFYRDPKVILHMFTTRLWTLLKINTPPTAVLAVGLPAILYTAGGADAPYEYFILGISVIGMSIFFSVHSLVLYYLLQPYNVNVETKNYMMGLADTLTYMFCFGISRFPLSVSVFGVAITAFCILYVAISLLLVFRLAPRTFRLRN